MKQEGTSYIKPWDPDDSSSVSFYQEIYGPPPTPVEIIKNVMGKKFEVVEIDSLIRIRNKKTSDIVIMRVEIIAHGSNFTGE